MRHKILLAFYPLFVKWNHGIALLSALCKQNGIDTKLVLLKDMHVFAETLSRYDGQLVGFSAVCSEDYRRSIPFMRKAKEAGKTVLLGGVWAGLNKPVDQSVDFVCRGDGESLPDFILNEDDTLFIGKTYEMDLDSLPLPDYELFKDIPFERGLPIFEGKKVLPYISSRGCYSRCSFCQVRHQYEGMRIRCKVGEDLSYLSDRYNPDIFLIGDAMLPYHDAKWRDSWGDFRHPFTCYIRADIKSDLLYWLIDRGMSGCAFGVESGDEKFRNEVLLKNLTDAQLFQVVDILRRNGIFYAPFFMTDYPGEKFTSKTKTRDMAESIGGYPIIWQYEDLKGA